MFHGPVILPHIPPIISSIYIIHVLGSMVLADTVSDLFLTVGQCKICFMVQ